MEDRIKARRRIVFDTPHGCNNDLADDIFARSWDTAAEAERAAVVAFLNEQAAWHDKNDDGWSGFDRIAQGYREAADAIESRAHLEPRAD